MVQDLTPKEYIENIKTRHLNSDKEFTLDSLAGAIDRLGKAFARYGSFLMEFVQNADDAESKSLRIEILDNAVRIFNDGEPFLEKDVRSICKVGRSSKTAKDYIGYLGVGFKSVFLISECPEIHSGGFRFRFARDAEDPANIPWQVIPQWIENPEIEITEKYNTAFNLKLKELKLLAKLEEEVSADHLSNRILLFLRHIKTIEIDNLLQNWERKIEKSPLSQTSEYEIIQLWEYEKNGVLIHQNRWLLFRSECDVEKEVKEDYVTKEWERETVEKREVLVAFKLDENENLTKEEKGTAHMGVFSFLPLKEVPSGLNFLIQADFLTGPGRVELARDCLWNNWLATQVYKLITKKCIPAFLSHEKWRMNFTEVLSSSEGGHELFENHIKKPLEQYLENNAVLIAEDGSPIRPDKAVSISPQMRELINENDLKLIFPGKQIIHPECSIPWNIEPIVEKGAGFSASGGLYYKGEELLNLKAKEQNVEFFIGFYRKYLLPYCNYSSTTLGRLKSHSVMLTDGFDLTNLNKLYIKPPNLTIPHQIEQNFNILHPAIAAEVDILEFLKHLDVPELSQENVQDILKRETLPEISSNWDSFSDEDKTKYIGFCKDLCEKGLDPKNLVFITLKIKKGEWLAPSKILFSKEYKPEHNIESLTEKFLKSIADELLQIPKDLLDMPTEFLSSEFIEGKDDREINEWRDFFLKLGVDSRLKQEQGDEKKGLTQRIGILTALHFESIQGRREAKELGESQKRGYDIESEGRCIEVKGRSAANPDIFLTTKEFKILHEKQEQYFVYVVKDALKHPTLCVARGDKLLGITDIKTIIPYNQWSSAKDEVFEL